MLTKPVKEHQPVLQGVLLKSSVITSIARTEAATLTQGRGWLVVRKALPTCLTIIL